MKKVDASRPGLGLPARLGILTLVLSGGVFASIGLAAKRNGADVGSYLTTFDVGKAYSQENFSYIAADAKLKLGDRKGCAALVKTLTFDKRGVNQSYQELRTALVRAQLAAGEFSEALASAQDDRSLRIAVLQSQTEKEGLDAMLANAVRVPEPDRAEAFGALIANWLGTVTVPATPQNLKLERIALSERLLPQLTKQTKMVVSTSFVTAYYKTNNLSAAIAFAGNDGSLLYQLGSRCIDSKDITGLKKVLERLPNEGIKVGYLLPGVKSKTTIRIASERQQMLERVASTFPAATTLELARTYGHLTGLSPLLRMIFMQAHYQQDRETVQASLALLRTQTSKEILDTVYTQMAADALHLGQKQIQKANWQGLDMVLETLRKSPLKDAPLFYDSLITDAVVALRQSDPERTKKLEAQAMSPEVRRQYQQLISSSVASAP